MSEPDAIPVSASARSLLRHTIATLAYRADKAVRGAPITFSEYRVAPGSRSAGEILAHMCDLMDWAIALAAGDHRWRNSAPQSWGAECARFLATVEAFDRYLAGPQPLATSVERLFQGPVADALTHTGQLMLLRRLAGSPVRGENYSKANITAGRIIPDPDSVRLEFD